MGRETNVYRANRWSVGLLILAAGGAGICLFIFYPHLDAYLRSVPLRRTFGFLRAVPPEVTIWSTRAVAAGLIAVAVGFCRIFFDPRLISVNANGIEVRHLLSTQRGRWRDFASMKAIGRKGMGTIRFFFKKAPGSHPQVTLPPKALGVQLHAVIADVSVHVMEPKRPAEGSLDKYDPKKLAKMAAEAVADGEDEAAVPAMVAMRRAFGKRNAEA